MIIKQENPLLKETQISLANVTSSSSDGTTKRQLKEDEEEDDDDEEGSVHDDDDKWSEEGESLLKVCNDRNIDY